MEKSKKLDDTTCDMLSSEPCRTWYSCFDLCICSHFTPEFSSSRSNLRDSSVALMKM